ncbi:unnamed protein product [Somion occarium]|uniref:Acetyl-CoA synthetase-like protein n=1 Tax=Somion occarium TaxID=3059160 RepID=A0ABP1CUG4_9APHY
MHPDNYKTLPIPPLPKTQCLSTQTFSQPKLDGSLTIPEIYDWHLGHSPQHPLFVYSDETGVTTTIYWPDGARGVHRAGRLVQYLAKETTAQHPRPLIFAILASTDTITYFTLMEGIIRAGYTVFPISPRNSAVAVAHLLTKTSAERVFVGPEVGLQDLAAASLKIMSQAGTACPILDTVPPFESFYPKISEADFEPLTPFKPNWDDPAVIMHSSGSTAFPKPIVWSHYRYFMLCIVPYLGERDMTGQRLACHSMPMYHGMGIMQTGWTATAGLTLTAFRPQSPAIGPTPELVIKGAIDTKSDVIFCVPSFIEAWAKNPEHVRHLQQIQGILYGGGPLSQSVGDALTKQDVSIFILYGCSECGIFSPILPKTSGLDWNYFTFPTGIETRFVWDSNGNAELLVLPGTFLVPNILNTIIDGTDAYATSDLLSPHPTKPGYWKIYGRADDQIMHNTGEKTNPAPLENILNQDLHIQASVIFGRGKFNAGVVIDPRAGFGFDPKHQDQLVEFRNKIWPTVERMNEYAPQHSRLFKEMIMVASSSKPFTYTAKNTARRQAIIADYEPEIEALYAAVDETTQADITPPSSWDLQSSLRFVREVVRRVLTHEVNDSDDIFQKGCDSLQATWIRNSLLHALRDTTNVNTRSFSSSFVYQHPSINALASFVTRAPGSEHSDANDSRPVENMLRIVDKYSASLVSHFPLTGTPTHDTVVLTGSTGGLGVNLLNQQSLKDRQRVALEERGFDAKIVDSEKVVLIETDLTKDTLGLSHDLLEEIRASATHIIHNAWPVNFNLSLSSFEPNIRSLRTLIDIALASPLPSPPRLIFISSVGVLRHVDTAAPIPEQPIEANVAVGTGYSESKWVAEKLLNVVASKSSLRPVSIRVGQVSGGASGAWNQAEWFPALVKSSVHLGHLPTLPQKISWISAGAVAQAIIEMRNSHVPLLHLAHPRPVPWQTMIEPIAKELALPLVSYDDWLELLEDKGTGLAPDAEVDVLSRFPALKLMDFFSRARETRSSIEAMGIPMLDVSEASRVAPMLHELPELTRDDVLSWLAYWRRSGFI